MRKTQKTKEIADTLKDKIKIHESDCKKQENQKVYGPPEILGIQNKIKNHMSKSEE